MTIFIKSTTIHLIIYLIKGEKTMGEKNKCQHPERLKGKPGECSPEQIKECHGDKKPHECEEKDKK